MGLWPERDDVWTIMKLSPRHCAACGTERGFLLVQTQRVSRPFWLLQVMTHRRRMILCEVCRQGQEIPQIEEAPSPPRPWKERLGIVFLIGLILTITLLILVKSFP